jgi:hypothetical protein
MAVLQVRGDVLQVRFTRPERFWGLLRDLDVPVSSITAAARVQRWREVRGFRVGTNVPRLWLTGRWYGRHRRQLVALRRGQPAVHLWLHDQKYDELLITTDHPEVVLAQLPNGQAG